MLVSAAGMIAELLVAAIAAIVWCRSDIGIVQYHAGNVMVTASLYTLLFNLNPLMRFDGYHLLADWMEIPNLSQHGRQYVGGLFRRHILKLPAKKLPWSGVRANFVKLYGAASTVWMAMIVVVLILSALSVLPGIGLVIALSAAGLWLARPLVKFAIYLAQGTSTEQPDRKRFAVAMGFLGAFCLLACLLPAPSVVSAPAVIDFEPMQVVRPEVGGFVPTGSRATRTIRERRR